MSSDTRESAQHGALQNSAHRILKSHREYAERLPPATETWRVNEVEIPDSVMSKFRHANVVRQVGEVDHRGSTHYVYRSRPAALALVDGLSEPATPCGHPGIHCKEAGETYTCGFGPCDEEFGRDAAWAEVSR
jgi:hypothetical protein